MSPSRMDPGGQSRDLSVRPFEKMRHDAIDEDLCEKYGWDSRLLFHLLPDNVLDHVIRYCSDKPKAINWPSFIAPEDLLVLYKMRGGLAKFISTRFEDMGEYWKILGNSIHGFSPCGARGERWNP